MSRDNKKIRGIILAGGAGTRLYPVTEVACKQLLPVYDKPLIYYPLSTLMTLGIKEILIISTPNDLPLIEKLLGDGSQLGLELSYKVQPKPEGIAQAFLLGEEFIGRDNVALILGDNIFHGAYDFKKESEDFSGGALLFAYQVDNPGRYGVVEFNDDGTPISIIEKPQTPKSNYAVTGLYLYDNKVVDIVKSLSPSARGELEITDVNSSYLKQGTLSVVMLDKGIAWLDSGTHDSMLEAANYIATVEKRSGQKVACPEEVAFRHGFIDKAQLGLIIDSMPQNSYSDYLKKITGDSSG